MLSITARAATIHRGKKKNGRKLPAEFPALRLHVKQDLQFKGFAVGFLRFIIPAKFVQADPFDVPGGCIIAVQHRCPGAGKYRVFVPFEMEKSERFF